MNNLNKWALMFTLCAGMIACSGDKAVKGDYGVIPLPQEVSLTSGSPFVLSSSTKICYPEGNEPMKKNAEFLSSYVKDITGYALEVTPGNAAKGIQLVIDQSIQNKEGYQLTVSAEGVRIAGSTDAGVFYGVQTLRKSIPATAQGMSVELPAVSINDYPRFSYRGMMLDVSRHFFNVEEIKEYIDILALHNQNSFHWHLSDDQGWRIEIKKYPKLTEIGSIRKETVIGHNHGADGEYDGKEYKGFYTQEEIKDIIAYAADRHITIIPEIDLPGHQLAALSAYPELGCTGGPYEVWTHWGVSEDVVCAGNEKAMRFLEDVLGEVIDLFPSEYIHVGGDECPKVRWQKCPKCQARIKAGGIKGDSKHTAEEYLQSYVISRMEKFIESKGRHLIGWDETLEGGLAPNATVMSWRGTKGGIEAAKQKHDVIMTPNSYVYFDYYQTADTKDEPLAIGGYLPVEKVYSFEPTDGIAPEYHQYIIGVQANVWTEYIPTFSRVQYMILPRMDAVADIQWSNPKDKDYQKFLPRVERMLQLYKHFGYTYANHIYDIRANVKSVPEKKAVEISLDKFGEGDIHYTLDGSEPTASSPKYDGTVSITKDAQFKAVAIRPDGKSRVYAENVYFNPATLKPITLKDQPAPNYTFGGAGVLVDGLRGKDNFKTGHWLGFSGIDADATIDLQEVKEVKSIVFNTCVKKNDWVFDASGAIVRVSEDGKNFKQVAAKDFPVLDQKDKDGVYTHEISINPTKARFVQVIVKKTQLPKWHDGAGKYGFIFIDEISIN